MPESAIGCFSQPAAARDTPRARKTQAAALVEEGARRFEALGVVAVAQVVDAHLAILRWGVDEAPVADVDADMRKRAVERVEKDQIARAQFIARDGAAVARDVGGAALDPQAGGLAVDVTDHAAAIEPGFRVLAAEAIAGVEQAHGVEDDLVALLADRARGLRYSFRRCGRARTRTAASGEQGSNQAQRDQDRQAHAAKTFSRNQP